MKVNRICLNCEKEFQVEHFVVAKKQGKYCSIPCARAYVGLKSRKGKDRNCKNCGRRFHVKPCSLKRGDGRGRFCSRICQIKNKSKKGTKIVQCLVCKYEFAASLSRIKRGSAKHCSRKCADKNRPPVPSKLIEFKCLACKKKFKVIPARAKKGNVKCCSKSCLGDWHAAEAARYRKRIGLIGNQRRSREYKKWRKLIYERDNYTCQECGDNKGGNLEAHHIKSCMRYPELMFNLKNGITLCKTCHKKTPNWGHKIFNLKTE